MTRKYLVQRFVSVFCLLSLKFKLFKFCFVGDLKTTMSVSLTFKDIFFALNHWTRIQRLKLNALFKF